MKSFGVIVWLVVAVVQVFAEVPVGYIEDVRSYSSFRIVSGWEAKEGQIPWQLSVRMVNPTGTVNSFGGSVIHPEWGLTAAHCPATRVTMVIRAGVVNLWRPELIFETTEYYTHPGYNVAIHGTVQTSNIALMKFPRAISFSDHVQPIRLQRSAEKNRNYDGVGLEASGFGRTWTDGKISNITPRHRLFYNFYQSSKQAPSPGRRPRDPQKLRDFRVPRYRLSLVWVPLDYP